MYCTLGHLTTPCGGGSWPKSIEELFVGPESLSEIDAMMVKNLDKTDMWVFSNNNVYVIEINTDFTWNIQSSWGINEAVSDNIWIQAPLGINAASWTLDTHTLAVLFVDEIYYVIYDVVKKEITFRGEICL